MPRLYIKDHNDLKQALANIGLSVAMEDTAATNLLEAERNKLSLVGDPNAPLVQNTLDGLSPGLTINDLAAVDRSAARLVAQLNVFHRMLMIKYTIAASAYLGHGIVCEALECAPSECPCDHMPDINVPCPCDYMPDIDSPCPCDYMPDIDAPCPCGYMPEENPLYCCGDAARPRLREGD
jgi:hypothetical protein